MILNNKVIINDICLLGGFDLLEFYQSLIVAFQNWSQVAKLDCNFTSHFLGRAEVVQPGSVTLWNIARKDKRQNEIRLLWSQSGSGQARASLVIK